MMRKDQKSKKKVVGDPEGLSHEQQEIVLSTVKYTERILEALDEISAAPDAEEEHLVLEQVRKVNDTMTFSFADRRWMKEIVKTLEGMLYQTRQEYMRKMRMKEERCNKRKCKPK